jgi:hypothetical protein
VSFDRDRFLLPPPPDPVGAAFLLDGAIVYHQDDGELNSLAKVGVVGGMAMDIGYGYGRDGDGKSLGGWS